MALQAIEATPKDRNPAFMVNQDTAGMSTVHSATLQRRGFSGEKAKAGAREI
jgi:hypothetical protein